MIININFACAQQLLFHIPKISSEESIEWIPPRRAGSTCRNTLISAKVTIGRVGSLRRCQYSRFHLVDQLFTQAQDEFVSTVVFAQRLFGLQADNDRITIYFAQKPTSKLSAFIFDLFTNFPERGSHCIVTSLSANNNF